MLHQASSNSENIHSTLDRQLLAYQCAQAAGPRFCFVFERMTRKTDSRGETTRMLEEQPTHGIIVVDGEEEVFHMGNGKRSRNMTAAILRTSSKKMEIPAHSPTPRSKLNSAAANVQGYPAQEFGQENKTSTARSRHTGRTLDCACADARNVWPRVASRLSHLPKMTSSDK